MSSNTDKRNRVSIQDIQTLYQTLQSHLSQLQPQQQQHNVHPSYDYIHKYLREDIKWHLLKFKPEQNQYQQFTELYLKCTEIIIQFIVKCSNQHYKELLLCLQALLGFVAAPMQCEIFMRSNQYKHQPKQGNFQFVQLPIEPQQYNSRYNKRNKSRQTPFNATCNCQLSVVDAFYRNVEYFIAQIKGRAQQNKFGVFDLQKVLLILYHTAKYANLDIQNNHRIYGPNLQQYIYHWVLNLDETSFEPASNIDELNAFTDLFTIIEQTFDKFIKKQSHNNHTADDQLLTIKLLFVSKLLKLNFSSKTMDRRVQALSLMKIVLEKARSDDHKYKNSNEGNEWHKTRSKSHHKHKPLTANNMNQSAASNDSTLREKCSDFILTQKLLDLLMSPQYVHKNLLSRLQPIIDVLCETNKMEINTITLLWNASNNKHSTELIQFDKMYLSLSKQLPTSLSKEFYDLIEKRYNNIDLKVKDQIEESHLAFIAQFTSNYIDKCKHGAYGFQGMKFLKNYAINFTDNLIIKQNLREFAFKQIEIILQKQSMKNHIVEFVVEMLTNIAEYIGAKLHEHQTLKHIFAKLPTSRSSIDPVDVTYCIHGMDQLLRTKFVGTGHEKLYCTIADAVENHQHNQSMLDLLVTELKYWYWYCSPEGFQPNKNNKQWNTNRSKCFKIRFHFMRIIAQKTSCVVRETHVDNLTDIPNAEEMEFYSSNNAKPHADFVNKVNELHHRQLKTWLNDCVAQNQKPNTPEILDENAIKSIFKQQFNKNMDYVQFKSWLAYFHDLNKEVYDLQKQEYRHWHPQNYTIIGAQHMWQVIEKNADSTNVVVRMMDELIKLNLVKQCYQNDPYHIHISASGGITDLFVKCHDCFRKFNSRTSSDKKSFKVELNTFRYALLLRRIIEYSIGKQSEYKAANLNIKLEIQYRKRSNNQQQSQQRYVSLDYEGKFCDSMTAIRYVIAQKLKQRNPREVQLYRKYKDRYIMIEEPALLHLTCYDLARKSNKKRMIIELEFSIITGKQSHSKLKSFAGLNNEFQRFSNVYKLLKCHEYHTLALSAYYILRYMPINEQFLDTLINNCVREPRKYFDPNAPLLNLYNLETLRYYADMDCVSDEERRKKEKVVKQIYSRKVFDVLFDVFMDQSVFTNGHKFDGILALLWIKQFNRLCFMFSEIRVLSGYRIQSDKIMGTLMVALFHMLKAVIPDTKDKALPLFDITLPDDVIQTRYQTIYKCFAIALNLMMNKQPYLDFKSKQQPAYGSTQNAAVNKNELEDIFLKGLRHLIDNLRPSILHHNTTIQEAFYSGIQLTMKYISAGQILSILMDILPTNNTPQIKYSPDFIKFLTVLIGDDEFPEMRQEQQSFISPVLRYVFGELKGSQDVKKQTLTSVLKVANTLYERLDSSFCQSVDAETHIELLITKCLFGSSPAVESVFDKPTLLCPSGSSQREQAFNLLYTIIQSHNGDARQQQLIDKLVASLVDHLNIGADSIVINDATEHIYDDEQKRDLQHVNNQREHFVGLVNLGATCYLNSILQQLFMVPSFTNEILSFDSSQTPQTTKGSNDTNVLRELQRLLLRLRQSQRKYMDPKQFAISFAGSVNPQFLYQQQDCMEALDELFSKLEDNLKNLNLSTHVLDGHFSCPLQYITKCCNGHCSTRMDARTYCLKLNVSDHSNISDALDKYCEGEVLDGDNKYNCEQCAKKVKAERRLTIFKPPKQLIIGLNRFTWNFDTNERIKLNTRFEFDPVIHIKKYLYFNFVDDVKYEEDDDDDKNDDEYIYDLVGIVIHQGTANTGHYYAYIKDRKGTNNKDEWYQFDDKKVSKKDYNTIQREAFGGANIIKINENESRQQKNDKNNVWNKKKINKAKQESVEVLSERSAYVLFYEQRAVKIEQRRKQKQQSQNEETKTNDIDMKKPWKNVKYLNEEHTRIQKENQKLFRQQTLYDEAFVKFMAKMYHDYGHLLSQKMADIRVLLRFIFNVVPIQIYERKEIDWWWQKLTDAMDGFNLKSRANLINSKILPSYLMNIFGKYGNANNRACALSFFRQLIKKVDALQKEQNITKKDDLLDKLMCVLISVIEEWKPVVLRANMQEIVELINCVWNCDKEYILRHWEQLMNALKKLMEKDHKRIAFLPRTISREIWDQLLSSDSNLNINAVCNLMWKLIEINDKNAHKYTFLSTKIEVFCRSLITRNYCESQVKIIQYIVKHNTTEDSLDTFRMIVRLIDFRIQYLDFYDVYGALMVFNGLFMDERDPYITDKLQTQCVKQHIGRIIDNGKFWKLTNVSIICLSELCKGNALVRHWIQHNCFGEMEELRSLVQKNKKQNKASRKRTNQYQNNNVVQYRHQPSFDKNKEQKKQWKNKMNNKLKGIPTNVNMQNAMNIINKKN